MGSSERGGCQKKEDSLQYEWKQGGKPEEWKEQAPVTRSSLVKLTKRKWNWQNNGDQWLWTWNSRILHQWCGVGVGERKRGGEESLHYHALPHPPSSQSKEMGCAANYRDVKQEEPVFVEITLQTRMPKNTGQTGKEKEKTSVWKHQHSLLNSTPSFCLQPLRLNNLCQQAMIICY